MIEREEERDEEGARLLHVLPRLAGVVDAVALRERRSAAMYFERVQRLAQGDAGHGTAEMVAELSCWKWLSDSGTTVGFELADGRQRHDGPPAVLM